VTPREPRKSTSADQTGDDFQKIAGIGQAIERRLHEAGILTYQDLAARSPEQIAARLTDVAGLSSARITSQDWTGQAGRLAGSAPPPLPSEPDQTYASFHIELLLHTLHTFLTGQQISTTEAQSVKRLFYSMIRSASLSFGKFFQALRLTAHEALELDNLTTSASATVDGDAGIDALVVFVASVSKLFVREIWLKFPLLATTTLDPIMIAISSKLSLFGR